MTSLHFDPAQFAAPAEQREPGDPFIVNGRYSLPPLDDPTGKRRSLQRATNFIKQLSDQEGLVKWKLRSVVEGLALREDLYDLACSLDLSEVHERDKIIERCIDAAKAYKGSGGNETGTALHNLTDATGKQPMRVRPKWTAKVENVAKALREKGLRPVPGLSERIVVSERYGTAGRLDDVYEDPFGVLRVGDRKSQKDFYTWWEVGAQLALYQCSDAMWNEQTYSWDEMPKLADDYVHVVWMPLAHPGPDPEGVTVYDLPLGGPRQVLEWCASVRELRTGARKWGQERQLDDFARIARDIRDAESHDDLRRLAQAVPAMSFEGDPLNRMAAKRWEELAAQAPPEPAATSLEPAATPLNGAVRVLSTSGMVYQDSGANLALFDGQYIPSGVITISREALGETPASAEAVVQGALLDSMLGFDPSLFVAPEGAEASFPNGGGSSGSVPASGGADAGRSALIEPRPDLGIATGWIDGEGVLRKPMEWAAHLKLGEGFRITADAEGVWCKPMTLETFRATYAKEIAIARGGEPGSRLATDPAYLDHAIAGIKAWTGALTPEEAMAEAPYPGDLPKSTNDRATAIEALDSVPLKVVKEVCTRARNSQSSRGRVRLLNDVEEKKYAAHGVELLPALLREWLEIDGGEEETAAGVAIVSNTEGAKRKAMHADLAGRLSLSAYLAEKGESIEAPKSAEVRDRESAAPVDDADVIADLAAGGYIDSSSVATSVHHLSTATVHDPSNEIRKPYAGLSEGPNAGRHSIARLVELAKDARNGAERAKVFHEITRRKAWTGEIAAEINQHYLDNGYATEDFDPYFEAIAIEGSPLPLDPDDPATAEDAIALLDGVTTLADLQRLWEALSSRPYFYEPRFQEALMARFAKVKA